MHESDTLSEQIHLLGDLLGRTIVEQEGRGLYDLVEEVRALAKADRGGNETAGLRLLARIEALPLAEARGVVKAFASYFQLVNLAEEQERLRILRRRAFEAEKDRPVDETIAAALIALREQGVEAGEVQSLVRDLLVMPVFTAHPTEAKRRTVLMKLARIADALHALDFLSLTPEEVEATTAVLREEIVSLWETEETRQHRPTVLDEVRNGLYYFESTLFDLVPELESRLRKDLAAVYPGSAFEVPHFLRFGSWIGGDRDGNPSVTPPVTEEALREHKTMALRLYQRALDRMRGHLSMSEARGLTSELEESLEADAALFPEAAARAAERYRHQPYRQKMALAYRKLAATLEAAARPWRTDHRPRPGTYADAKDLLADLRLVQASLRAHSGARLAEGRLGTLTEQGEAITTRYANRHLARRHLEQLVHAVLVSSGKRPIRSPSRGGAWERAMNDLSPLADGAYRALVQNPELPAYFQAAAPVDEIERLNIGSRPARRAVGSSLQGLRAIPWVFAWTQSRVTLAGWYGLGHALAAWAQEDAARWETLAAMYRDWAFFRTLVDNCQVSLGKADMRIAEAYAGLAAPAARAAVFPLLEAEHARTTAALCRLTGQRELLDHIPWLQRSIRVRNPYIDPMNYVQAALLRRLRTQPAGAEAAALRAAVLLSVNGIAAGLRNTG